MLSLEAIVKTVDEIAVMAGEIEGMLDAGRPEPGGSGRETAGTVLDGYMSTAELAEELNVTRRTLDRWELAGQGPAFIRLGKRRLYHREAVAAWLRAKEKPAKPASRIGRQSRTVQ